MKHSVLLWLRIDCSRSVERGAPQLLRPVTDGGRSMKWLGPVLLVSATIASANHELDNRDLVSGQTLYTNNCASCHGAKLEGQPNWRSPNADGVLPAPPHDPTGHTWHHDNGLLFEYQSWVGKGHWRQGVLPISIVGCLLSMVSSQMKISGIFSLSSGQHGLNVNNNFRKALTQRTDAAAVRQNLLVRSQKGLIRVLNTSNVKARPCYLRNVGYDFAA